MSRLDFLYRTELPHRAIAVYIYLADRTNENNECWPAIPTIAADLKYSPSIVRRGIRDLKKAGLLETEQRYRKKGGKSSLLFRLKSEQKSKILRQGATEQMSFCRFTAKRIMRSLRRRCDRCHLSWW